MFHPSWAFVNTQMPYKRSVMAIRILLWVKYTSAGLNAIRHNIYEIVQNRRGTPCRYPPRISRASAAAESPYNSQRPKDKILLVAEPTIRMTKTGRPKNTNSPLRSYWLSVSNSLLHAQCLVSIALAVVFS